MQDLDTISQVWDMVRNSFLETMNKTTVDLWFGNISIGSFDINNRLLVFKTDSEMKQQIIKTKYLNDIIRKFSEILGFEINIDVIYEAKADRQKTLSDIKNLREYTKSDESETAKPEAGKSEAEKKIIGSTKAPFNFEYTFDNFIVGNSNKFAYAACMAVSEHPATDYNPLFIYGPSGIGKTHLLYAITNALKQKNPDISVIYIKGDDFTNQLIESLSRGAMKEFREKYRTNCDVLLIDDIQFIAGKISTQEEFFHTFNALFDYGKQIILTSDRPPREIKTLEDRLKTRFEWGLIADIQPPDLELRIAIIKKKAEQADIKMPDDVLYYFAENLRSNIRQIEGAIRKLSAKHFISGEDITMDTAKNYITELLGGAEPISVTVEKIFTAIYNKYGINKADLVSTKRTREIANARHIAIYLIRKVTDMSLPGIGKIFDRDHSTVMSSIATIESKINSQNVFKLEMDNIIHEIKEM